MVIREDMSYMQAVFQPINRNKPSLPYDEFIVDWGSHPLGVGGRSKIGGHYFAKYVFPNGKKVSVVCGQLFYSTVQAPYEVWVTDANGNDETDDPLGFQTDEDLMILLAKAIGDIK
jgi:hypothetical protein